MAMVTYKRQSEKGCCFSLIKTKALDTSMKSYYDLSMISYLEEAE